MNKVTLITGASSGIGQALVELFSKNNHKILAISRNPDKVLKHKNVFPLKAGHFVIKIFVVSQTLKTFPEPSSLMKPFKISFILLAL